MCIRDSTGTTEQAMQQSLVTAAVREHGRDVLAGGNPHPMTGRAYQIINNVATESGTKEAMERMNTGAVEPKGLAAEMKRWMREAILVNNERTAKEYWVSIAKRIGCDRDRTEDFLSLIHI